MIYQGRADAKAMNVLFHFMFSICDRGTLLNNTTSKGVQRKKTGLCGGCKRKNTLFLPAICSSVSWSACGWKKKERRESYKQVTQQAIIPNPKLFHHHIPHRPRPPTATHPNTGTSVRGVCWPQCWVTINGLWQNPLIPVGLPRFAIDNTPNEPLAALACAQCPGEGMSISCQYS